MRLENKLNVEPDELAPLRSCSVVMTCMLWLE
jgi:hypothetical protein